MITSPVRPELVEGPFVMLRTGFRQAQPERCGVMNYEKHNSDTQVMLRQQGRIGDVAWDNWRRGIRFNWSLPDFGRAWDEVKRHTSDHSNEFFSELWRLEADKFQSDPKQWN